MNLNDAIKECEWNLRGVYGEAWHAILAAAKKQLAEEEATDHETHMRVYLENQRELNRKVAEHVAEHEAAWKARQEEAKRPKRASLERLEDRLRNYYSCGHKRDEPDCGHCRFRYELIVTADILKALREVVIPWMRGLQRDGHLTPAAMLQALGEEP